jgi:hypothetical protein
VLPIAAPRYMAPSLSPSDKRVGFSETAIDSPRRGTPTSSGGELLGQVAPRIAAAKPQRDAVPLDDASDGCCEGKAGHRGDDTHGKGLDNSRRQKSVTTS